MKHNLSVKFSTFLFGAPLAMAVIVACSSPTNPQLGQRAQTEPVYTNASQAAVAGQTPEVDVLIVADDSDSMTKHLAQVQLNMDQFTTAFADQANVNYHVGLVKVYDSTRYGTPKVPVFVANGELQNDELDKQLVKNLLQKTPMASADQQKAAVENSPQWVERSQKESDTLASLKMLLNFKTKSIADGGPNKEEIFSPIATAFQEPALSSARNKGFYRPEANLAVIILTDAEDSSPNTTEKDLASQLITMKGGDASKISVYAALALGTCPKDFDNEAPEKIKAFIGEFHGLTNDMNKDHIFNLCDPKFGAVMAKVGQDIAARVKVDTTIPLSTQPSHPEAIVVTYGVPGQPQATIPRTAFNYANGAVTVNPTALRGFTPTPGAKFYATYTGYSDQEKALMVRRQK